MNWARILPYVQIARPNHWIKNIFMLPGILLVLFFDPHYARSIWWVGVALGFAAACLIASSNYVLNEILDAETDRHHPEKQTRPIPSGKVRIPVAYAEFALLGLCGVALGLFVSARFGLAAALLWLTGPLYNARPIRLKDVPYGDVLMESVNNPIRMAMGWYATGYGGFPTLSVLMAYWMFGAFLMATKRFAEYRRIGDSRQAARYRRSFSYYDERRLLIFIVFCATLFGMFSGVFISRYHVELLAATPLVGAAMAYYLQVGFRRDSLVQYPERLHEDPLLTGVVGLAFVACVVLLFIDIPLVGNLFTPQWPLHDSLHETLQTVP